MTEQPTDVIEEPVVIEEDSPDADTLPIWDESAPGDVEIPADVEGHG